MAFYPHPLPSSLLSTAQKRHLFYLLAVVMIVTRGSHVGSTYLFPDATYAVMLFGGILLGSVGWFALLIALAGMVDILAITLAGVSSKCITLGYSGLFLGYGMLWFAGLWLQEREKRFLPLCFFMVSTITLTLAYGISTWSYVIAKGKFTSWTKLLSTGWRYFPGYLESYLIYLVAGWIVLYLFTQTSSKSHCVIGPILAQTK